MMKRTILILALSLTGGLLFAQAPAEFGLKGGLNISHLRQNSENLGDSRIGLHLGGLAHIHLSPNWGIQPELLFSQEGGYVTRTTVAKLDHINIPVMVQYMFNNGFRIEAGPQLGVLVNAKLEDDDGVEVDASEDFNSANFSLGAGLSYLSHSGFGVGARGNFGLSDVSEGNIIDTRARTIQVSLFYLFNTRHKAQSR